MTTIQRRDFSIMGTTFQPGAWQFVQRLRPNIPLTLKREPMNKYDTNAVAVYYGAKKLGFVPRGLAKDIAPLLDAGVRFECARSTTRLQGVPRPGVLALAWDDDEVKQLHQHADDGGPVPENM